MRPRYEDLELVVYEDLKVPSEPVRLPSFGIQQSIRVPSTTDHRLDLLAAIALVVLAVLLIVALTPAPSGGSNPGQLHGAGLTGSVLRGAPVGRVLAPRYAGTATWYCGHGSRCTRGYGPSDMVAAIDTDLGFRKGQSVVVRYRDRAVTVKIVDVCGCAGERLIDLTSGAFSRLAPLGLGVLPVTVESASGILLPATDTVP